MPDTLKFSAINTYYIQSLSRFIVTVQITAIKVSVVQSGASSLAKHGGAYFSAVYGSIQDPIAAPGPYENQVF